MMNILHRRIDIIGILLLVVAGFVPLHAETPEANGNTTQSAEYKRGRILFIQCRACHELQPTPATKVGPHLGGIIGRPAAAVEDFSYSPALMAAKLTFDKTTLDRWIEKPSAVVVGNVMAFSGIANADDRAALIRYLEIETAPR